MYVCMYLINNIIDRDYCYSVFQRKRREQAEDQRRIENGEQWQSGIAGSIEQLILIDSFIAFAALCNSLIS